MKEGNVLLNNTLNSFCVRLYDIRHMVQDHSDSDETCCCHCISYYFHLAARVFLCVQHPRKRTAYVMAFVTPLVKHWLEQEIAQWVHHEGLI